MIQYKNISVFYLLHDDIHVLFRNKMKNKNKNITLSEHYKIKYHIVETLQNKISKA